MGDCDGLRLKVFFLSFCFFFKILFGSWKAAAGVRGAERERLCKKSIYRPIRLQYAADLLFLPPISHMIQGFFCGGATRRPEKAT